MKAVDPLGVAALICFVISAFIVGVVNRFRDSKWADALFAVVLLASMSAGFAYLDNPEGWRDMQRPSIGADR